MTRKVETQSYGGRGWQERCGGVDRPVSGCACQHHHHLLPHCYKNGTTNDPSFYIFMSWSNDDDEIENLSAVLRVSMFVLVLSLCLAASECVLKIENGP